MKEKHLKLKMSSANMGFQLPLFFVVVKADIYERKKMMFFIVRLDPGLKFNPKLSSLIIQANMTSSSSPVKYKTKFSCFPSYLLCISNIIPFQ